MHWGCIRNALQGFIGDWGMHWGCFEKSLGMHWGCIEDAFRTHLECIGLIKIWELRNKVLLNIKRVQVNLFLRNTLVYSPHTSVKITLIKNAWNTRHKHTRIAENCVAIQLKDFHKCYLKFRAEMDQKLAKNGINQYLSTSKNGIHLLWCPCHFFLRVIWVCRDIPFGRWTEGIAKRPDKRWTTSVAACKKMSENQGEYKNRWNGLSKFCAP